VVAGILTTFGIIHSPLVGEKMFWPWELFDESMAEHREMVLRFAIAYGVTAVILAVFGVINQGQKTIDTDKEFEAII
jgi:hypothetical protein